MSGAAAPASPFARELARVRARRLALRASNYPDSAAHRPDLETVGLALSGGGIRSATFALGLLRAFSDARRIRHIDFLSTVSGGGYTGAFLCSHYVPSAWRGDIAHAPERPLEFTEEDPFRDSGGAAAFEHLRQSGRHLLPGGTGDAIRLAALMTRNWLAVQTVIGVSLLGLYMILKPVQAWLLLPPQLDFEATHLAPHLPPWLWPSQWLHGYPLGHWFIASPLWLGVMLGGVVQGGLFWAYFLTRGNPAMYPERWKHAVGPSLVMAVVLLVVWLVMAGSSWPPGARGDEARAIGAGLAPVAAIAIVAYVAAEFSDWLKTRAQVHASHHRRMADGTVEAEPTPASTRSTQPRVQEDRVRLILTNWNGACLKITLAIAGLALLDSVAQTAYVRWDEIGSFLRVGGGAAVAIPVLRQLLLKLPGIGNRSGGALAQVMKRFGRLLALAAGLALASVIGTFWAILAQFAAWRGGPIGSLEMWHRDPGGPAFIDRLTRLDWLWLTSIGHLGVAILVGICFAFLNLSSFAHFYASRLRRAYLGASNADRRIAGTSTNADHINDDVSLERYYDPRVLAPLHLINVTVNDTASGAANTVHRDRRGKPLVVSSVGYMYQVDGGEDVCAAVDVIPFADGSSGTPETLPLSSWIGISGAAASTGVGQMGSIGLSLLAGLANIRLGYWWNSGLTRVCEPKWRNAVQARLADELVGRFPGTDGRRWNLTDGGHFENSAVYELVRRRVAFIVASDCGADPAYAFEDLVTLTRRIKIDFDAELTFLDAAELDALLGKTTKLREAFGSLGELGIAGGEEPRFGPYAALGRISYHGVPPPGVLARAQSTLLLVKPRVAGREALDLVAYARANPPFPQQSTLDQFFDEAQWESYFSLGRLIGDHLLARDEDDPGIVWRPAGMRPLP